MTEANQVNGAIRAHLGPLGLFRRCEHAYDVGWPDWWYALRGTSGWIEAKLIPATGQCPDHFTLDQIFWAEKTVAHGVPWFLLGLRAPRSWVLYDVGSARKWFDGIENLPIFDIPGKFPTAEVVRVIAPRPLSRRTA